METQSKSITNSTNRSKMIHALIYFSLGLSFILQAQPPSPEVTLTLLKEAAGAFLGSISAIFLAKFFAAASGSASGARMMPTKSNLDFWIKVGIGLAFSLCFSSTVHNNLPAHWKVDILSVCFTLGVIGVLLIKMVTSFVRRMGSRSDDMADTVADTIVANIKRFKPKPKKDADK